MTGPEAPCCLRMVLIPGILMFSLVPFDPYSFFPFLAWILFKQIFIYINTPITQNDFSGFSSLQ